MNPIVLIPARLASTRLPDKPLADIAGVPMIVRVWRQAVAAAIGPVVVAAAEDAIVQAIEAAGGRAVLTDPDLPSGTDRIHLALERIDPRGVHDVVVNLQGDLPALDPAHIRLVAAALTSSGADIATLAVEIDDPADFDNPAVVKPVVAWDGATGRALYFTRARAPFGEGPLYHHLGVYVFRRATFERFVSLPVSALEKRERLEQLRALEDGMRIDAALLDKAGPSVDTERDLDAARELARPEGAGRPADTRRPN